MDKGRLYHFFYTDLNQGIREENIKKDGNKCGAMMRKARKNIFNQIFTTLKLWL
jgi:hypothetical protein